jgi:hypothetical protein
MPVLFISLTASALYLSIYDPAADPPEEGTTAGLVERQE